MIAACWFNDRCMTGEVMLVPVLFCICILARSVSNYRAN